MAQEEATQLASAEAPADASSIVLQVIGDENVGKTTLCQAFATRSVRAVSGELIAREK